MAAGAQQRAAGERFRTPAKRSGRSTPPAGFWWVTSARTERAVSEYLETALPELLQDARVNVILLGRGSGRFS